MGYSPWSGKRLGHDLVTEHSWTRQTAEICKCVEDFKAPEEAVDWSLTLGAARLEWPTETESLSRSHVEGEVPQHKRLQKNETGSSLWAESKGSVRAVGWESAQSEKPLGVGGGGAGESCGANFISILSTCTLYRSKGSVLKTRLGYRTESQSNHYHTVTELINQQFVQNKQK